jgi:hypothetical protein
MNSFVFPGAFVPLWQFLRAPQCSCASVLQILNIKFSIFKYDQTITSHLCNELAFRM